MQWLIEQYRSNEFLVGTTVPFLLAAAAIIARQFWRVVWAAILRATTVSIRLNNDVAYYPETCAFAYQHYVRGTFRRNLSFSYKFNGRSGRFHRQPGYGVHLAWVGRWPGLFNRVVEESQSSSFKEYFSLRVFTLTPPRTLDAIHKDLQGVVNLEFEDQYLRVYVSGGMGRYMATRKPKRSLSTMEMDPAVMKRIIDHLSEFLASREACEDVGVPWHTGILFHGRPGSGKSSMTHAIASYLDRDVHIHTGGKLHNQEFDPDQCILALEDIDASAMQTSTEDRTKVMSSERDGDHSMADFLNYLDGFLTPHGLIAIATTNHLDKLDPALTRPGRFDLVIDMDAATSDYRRRAHG